jgi:ubiquinol-cytochrome c reductase cytochrome b subunit
VRLRDWLHARTGYRNGLSHLLNERLPPGTGWWFTLGSVLLFLIVLQGVTGLALSLYYAPTPGSAYQSVQFITERVPLGKFVRGLHYFGASALVIFAVLHVLRVVAFGSYKAPREATWLSGVGLLLLVLAFALTGYLLPWDQRAYWATVVSVNIVRLAPVGGEVVAAIAGAPGGRVGALTLSRWFAIHAIALPALVAVLVVLHVFLMRRHGISGPVHPRTTTGHAFYPYQAARDVTVIAVVAVIVGALAWRGLPALERPADPTDASYIPRPEWYFLGLFQLLKFMPGRLEIVGALVLPALAVALLALLPWIDRGPVRDPRRRKPILAGVAAAALAIAGLTAAGWRDRPERPAPGAWSVREIAGGTLVAERKCARCHADGRMADAVGTLVVSRPVAWVRNHVVDPEVIAPGIRSPASTAHERDVSAIVSYLQRAGLGGTLPEVPDATRRAMVTFARHCIGCHLIDGDGGSDGPDLSHVGRERDAAWLARWIARPTDIRPDAEMPAFARELTETERAEVAAFLSRRR